MEMVICLSAVSQLVFQCGGMLVSLNNTQGNNSESHKSLFCQLMKQSKENTVTENTNSECKSSKSLQI